ncbi:prepilin-type N-terminal cleavage/methylation domain-containing protein [Desulfobotulus sp. H1]|uniref:Prepilin-type N-terminal cleavage/methylation domain-containing protein n=1 Tax=Desulfobotulus pelophilus TaxID=2823377 RepID=A0ABT3N683_9BACT|nr:prepilin-type N-terminal cleavage/methylation domain-containing protein [Desulfobotulus pelophilus]MCW7752954.1 prepilin-type N-terminal cleavage/methylation domain-containing protein [Desulfobotulus pelophilus]
MAELRKKEREWGFTLLEVMIALSILAIVLTAVLRLHGQSIRLLERSRTAVVAPWLAAGVVSRLATALPDPPLRQGNFDGFPDFSWKASVTPASGDVTGMIAEEESQHLFWVGVEVRRHGEVVYSIGTLRGDLP